MTPNPETSLSVLIVEDDLALLAFLVTRLEYEHDMRVAGYATDAAEALRLCTDLKPDIVLSDFDLPDLDGVALVGSLRVLLPDSALVLYTGAWSSRLERAARLAGADDCLDKSIPPSEVVAALRAGLLSRRSAALPEPQSASG